MIKLPQFHIVIEGRSLEGASRTAYEQRIQGVISVIQSRKSGRLVLDWIRNCGTGLWVVVAPYGPYWRKRHGAENALAHGDLEIVDGAWWAMKVNFSAETWNMPCAKGSKLCGGPGFLADEVLLHEFVHAQRDISGLSRQVSLANTSLRAYDNEEEFFAVTVANLYISESGRGEDRTTGASRLRSSHKDDTLPETGDNVDLIQFVDTDYVRLIKKYCEQHPRLSRGLAGVNAQFNPFRTHYRLAS